MVGTVVTSSSSMMRGLVSATYAATLEPTGAHGPGPEPGPVTAVRAVAVTAAAGPPVARGPAVRGSTAVTPGIVSVGSAALGSPGTAISLAPAGGPDHPGAHPQGGARTPVRAPIVVGHTTAGDSPQATD